MTRVVFFGDSICVGQLVQPHLSWVNMHSQRWGEKMPDQNILVSNVSISGNTTRMGLDRIKMQVSHTGADVFYTQFGLNDANHWHDDGGLPRSLPATYKANLIEILERARAWGAKQLVIGTNHPVPDKDENRWPDGVKPYSQWVADYNEIVREVAIETGAALIDHERCWQENKFGFEEYLLQDGVHLSVAGHREYLKFSSAILDEQIRLF